MRQEESHVLPSWSRLHTDSSSVVHRHDSVDVLDAHVLAGQHEVGDAHIVMMNAQAFECILKKRREKKTVTGENDDNEAERMHD
jgi:hypothetical protein